MASTSTTWAKGVTGNPGGRPAAMRTALRRALNRTDPPPEPMTRLERWAEEIVSRSISVPDRLAVLEFIEGVRPEPRAER